MMMESYILVLILLASACIILIALAFVSKRKSFKPQCCHGLPGPVVPVNLLDGYDNRLGYCLGFGALASAFVNTVIMLKDTIGSNSSFINALTLIAMALMIGVLGYPIFACLSSKNKAIGSIVGLLYCSLWLSSIIIELVEIFSTTNAKKTSLFLLFMVALPRLICVSLLLVKFLVNCVQAIRHRSWASGVHSDGSENTRKYVLYYTRHLFQKGKEACIPDNLGMKLRIKRLFYQWKPEFKYSTRVVCTFAVCYIIVYIMLIIYFIIIIGIQKSLRNYFNVAQGVLYASAFLTSIRSCLILFHMMSCYRKHLTRLRRGDRSWLPASLQAHNASATSLMVSSMRFSGLQIGYTIYGSLLSFVVTSVGFSAVYFLFKKNLFSSIIIWFLKRYWATLLLLIFIFVGQRILVKFVFLKERGKILSVDNRKAYHIVTYFFFIYTIFFGFVSALSRSLRALIIGCIFFENVQSSVLPRSFETFDPGYNAYLGYLLVEHVHAHPVMRAFVFIAEDYIAKRSLDLETSLPCPIGKYSTFENERKDQVQPISSSWRTARNRWQLAVTLIRNPSLTEFRKSNLAVVKDEDVEIVLP